MSTPTPVILCGKTTQVGASVIVGLKPEYEVIHFIQSTASACSAIPLLLSGRTPSAQPGEENIGTKNYARMPRAVILGGGYSDDDIAQMRAACRDFGSRVLWLRPDLARPSPPLGPEYGRHMVARLKVRLGDPVIDSEMEGDESTLLELNEFGAAADLITQYCPEKASIELVAAKREWGKGLPLSEDATGCTLACFGCPGYYY